MCCPSRIIRLRHWSTCSRKEVGLSLRTDGHPQSSGNSSRPSFCRPSIRSFGAEAAINRPASMWQRSPSATRNTVASCWRANSLVNTKCGISSGGGGGMADRSFNKGSTIAAADTPSINIIHTAIRFPVMLPHMRFGVNSAGFPIRFNPAYDTASSSSWETEFTTSAPSSAAALRAGGRTRAALRGCVGCAGGRGCCGCRRGPRRPAARPCARRWAAASPRLPAR